MIAKFMRCLTGFILASTVTGCTSIDYYGQAVAGQWELLSLRRPVDELLADPNVSEALRRRLEIARQLRGFASTELALPANGSYRSYVDLQRPYVVKNVFAAPALSLHPKEWCFPVAGCVGYRGYFRAPAAQRLADELRAQGYDVYVADIPAYSTLGWFDDPLLNTFVHWPSGRLAELIFHELAHQRLYLPGDTAFNESYATVVGRTGARHWLSQHGSDQDRARYETFLKRREAFLRLAQETRDKLARLYASTRHEQQKHSAKKRLLAELKARYQTLKQEQWDGYAGYDTWFARDLNNAKLAALNTYTQYVPAFEALFRQTGEDFAAFHRAVAQIAALPPTARETRLQALQSTITDLSNHAGPDDESDNNGSADHDRPITQALPLLRNGA